MDQALQIAFEKFPSKIDEKTQFKVGKFQISEDLFAMNPGEGFYRFEFDQYEVTDNKVSPEPFIELDSAKVDWNGFLALYGKTLFL